MYNELKNGVNSLEQLYLLGDVYMKMGFFSKWGNGEGLRDRARYLYEYIKKTFDDDAKEKLKLVHPSNSIESSAITRKCCGTEVAKSSKSSLFERPGRRSIKF